MSLESQAPCPFDWVDGANAKLKGGELLAVTDNRFAYAFFGPDGRFTNAFIAGVSHGEDIVTLLTTHPAELAQLMRAVLDRLNGADYNVYANHGAAAGMTVANHAHLHILLRNADEPATGMGMGKLVAEYNKLYVAH